MAAFTGEAFSKGTRVVITEDAHGAGLRGTVVVVSIGLPSRNPTGYYVIRLDDGRELQRHHSELAPASSGTGPARAFHRDSGTRCDQAETTRDCPLNHIWR